MFFYGICSDSPCELEWGFFESLTMICVIHSWVMTNYLRNTGTGQLSLVVFQSPGLREIMIIVIMIIKRHQSFCVFFLNMLKIWSVLL